jgi:flagellar hook-basal body complex protein FliE
MSGSISSIVKMSHGLAAYQRSESEVAGSPGDFSNYVSNALTDTVKQSATAENLAQAGLSGQGDLTKVVTSVAQAQLALQTTVAIRDRLISAYQSIMSMPI